MNQLKKWLLPLLTCLLVVSAAVLPQRLSQARDSQQFGHVHTEELNADALPAAQQSTLLDRMELFANQYSSVRPILSSSTGAYADSYTKQEQALALQDLLISHIVPGAFFTEYTGTTDEAFEFSNIQRLLLWDPAGELGVREPSCYYQFAWSDYETYHNKSILVDVDAETGLPIQIIIQDTDMAKWFPYTRQDLQNKVDCYFSMMGWTEWVDVVPIQPFEPENKFHQLCFSVEGTDLYYWIFHGPTTLNISLEFFQDDPEPSGSVPDSNSGADFDR